MERNPEHIPPNEGDEHEPNEGDEHEPNPAPTEPDNTEHSTHAGDEPTGEHEVTP
jgi:hypothetical protein